MHHLKNITYSESFVPAGGPANETYKGEASYQPSDPMTYGVVFPQLSQLMPEYNGMRPTTLLNWKIEPL
jgi:hypothetical protein